MVIFPVERLNNLLDVRLVFRYYIDNHLYLIDPELKDEAIAAIIEKYENDSTFNPENVVLYGNSFTLTETGSLKASLARPEKNKKNLQIKIDIR